MEEVLFPFLQAPSERWNYFRNIGSRMISKHYSFHLSLLNPPLLKAFFEKHGRHIVLIFFSFGLQKLQTGIA
jgi:hypothetical protein